MGVTAKEAEGERGGEQRTAASSSGSFRFRDVLEAEDASCLRGCCVDDVLRGRKPARVCVMPGRRISRLQLPLLNRCLCDVC